MINLRLHARGASGRNRRIVLLLLLAIGRTSPSWLAWKLRLRVNVWFWLLRDANRNCLLVADCVEKLENRETPKISQM
jgi:hypothetical protein